MGLSVYHFEPKKVYVTLSNGGSRISHRGGVHLFGGHGPPLRALFSENVCENERIGSHRGRHAPGTPPLDPPMLSVSEDWVVSDQEQGII